MTHEERIALLESQPGETVSPAVVSQVLGGMPYTYNIAAKQGKLTLPHLWRGNRLLIFKQPLINLLKGEPT
jgi:hypothetical protein